MNRELEMCTSVHAPDSSHDRSSSVRSDERLLTLVDASVPKGMAEDVFLRLAGPPAPVLVTLLWVDTRRGDILGGTATVVPSGVSLTLGSSRLSADKIPQRATQALRTWLAGLMAAPDSVEFTGADGVAHTLAAAAFAP